MNNGPLPIIVGASYEISGGARSSLLMKKKYGSLASYEAFHDKLEWHQDERKAHNLHEVLLENQPRSLYFDIDGDISYASAHDQIAEYLQSYVRWFFCGDRLGWEADEPQAVVLATNNSRKYSCHVVFPQIQFANHAHQSEYMPDLLAALRALVVDLEDGKSVHILDEVVDRVPYSRFQLFRGPHACKLYDKRFLWETELVPQDLFRHDPLTSFAGYTNPDYALELPRMSQLMAWNPELAEHTQLHRRRLEVIRGGRDSPSLQDQTNLYLPRFQRSGGGFISFAGMPDLDNYELALASIHPDRATQYWSWFRICGVTTRMLEMHGQDEASRRRIWEAHHRWSSQFQPYDAEENVEMVEKKRGRPVSGIKLLLDLVTFDNPETRVRSTSYLHSVAARKLRTEQQ